MWVQWSVYRAGSSYWMAHGFLKGWRRRDRSARGPMLGISGRRSWAWVWEGLLDSIPFSCCNIVKLDKSSFSGNWVWAVHHIESSWYGLSYCSAMLSKKLLPPGLRWLYHSHYYIHILATRRRAGERKDMCSLYVKGPRSNNSALPLIHYWPEYSYMATRNIKGNWEMNSS